MRKKQEWVEIDEGNAKTYPPPFRRIEIETRPRALYSRSTEYVHCFGYRSGITEVTVHFGHYEEKIISLFNIVKWRVAHESRVCDAS